MLGGRGRVWWIAFVAFLWGLLLGWVSAAPAGPETHVQVPLMRRNSPPQGGDLFTWANAERDRLRGKYGIGHDPPERHHLHARAPQGLPMLNFAHDGMWVTTVQVGTPPKPYKVVIDTGSSDMWLKTGDYKPKESHSFQDLHQDFNAKYASGEVAGHVVSDTVQLGSLNTRQSFALVSNVSNNILAPGVSGILGFGFTGLARIHSLPFWENAKLPAPLFSLYVKRQEMGSQDQDDGGVFTLGGMNHSLFQGEVSYAAVMPPSPPRYWSIPLNGMHVQGHSLDLKAPQNAAIDSGTTLIGGLQEAVEQFYSRIPGSGPVHESPGYYAYPCSATVNLSMAFVGRMFQINDIDFQVQVVAPAGSDASSDGPNAPQAPSGGDTPIDPGSAQCLGAVFSLGPKSMSGIQWIVGDTFLKNVYTVFRADKPHQVGFAALADGLNSGTVSTPYSQRLSAAPQTAAPQHAAALAAAFALTLGIVLGI